MNGAKREEAEERFPILRLRRAYARVLHFDAQRLLDPAYVILACVLLGHLCASVWEASTSSLNWLLMHDASPLAHIARRILSGDVPYMDILDMNFPGSYLLYMLWQSVWGFKDFAFRYFDLSMMALIAVSMTLFCRALPYAPGVLAGVFFAAQHLSEGNYMAGQRDYILIPFLISAADLMASHVEKPRSRYLLLLAGMLLAFATLIKPTMLLMSLVLMGIYAFYPRVQRIGWQEKTFNISWIVLGHAATYAPTALWLLWLGALPAFWEVATVFAPWYRQHYFHHFTFDWRLMWSFMWPAAAVGAAGVLALRLRWLTVRNAMLLAGIVVSACSVYVQRKGWYYHWTPFMAFVTLFVAYNLPRVILGLRSWIPQIACFFCVLWAGGFIYAEYAHVVRDGRYGDTNKTQILQAMKDVKRARAEALAMLQSEQVGPVLPSLHFFDLGNAGPVWAAAYRGNWKPAMRYVYGFSLQGRGYAPGTYQSFKQELHDDPPDILIFGPMAQRLKNRLLRDKDFSFLDRYRGFVSRGTHDIYIRNPQFAPRSVPVK